VDVHEADRVPAYRALADRLRDRMTSGALRPGDRLPTEPRLCAEFGLSRSTVREALRLLASQNLIVTLRGVNGGSFVAEPSTAELGDLLSTGLHLLMATGTVTTGQWLEVRATFEVPVAGLAALRRTDAQLAELTGLLFDPDGTPPDRVVAEHMAFHTLLAELTGNPLFRLAIQPLYAVGNERALGEAAPPGFWRRVDADHRRLVRAIADQDAAAARAAASEHLAHVHDTFAGGEPGVELSREPVG
jgi:DNA-binding FadR family transcriptional regulator